MPEAPTFRTSIRVRTYELDAYGHVNHAVYLNYMEHARVEALAAAGIDMDTLLRRGWQIHMVRVEVDYRAGASIGDELTIETTLQRLGRTSMTVRQLTRRGDTVVADALVTGVWVGPDGRPIPVPPEIASALGGTT